MIIVMQMMQFMNWTAETCLALEWLWNMQEDQDETTEAEVQGGTGGARGWTNMVHQHVPTTG